MTLKNMIELADGLTPIETEIGYYILKHLCQNQPFIDFAKRLG
mgnify:CR=1 FL=1